jgi:flagellar protein FlaJ
MISGIAYKLFGKIAEKYANNFSFLKDYLLKADVKIPFTAYLSTTFFLSSLIFISSFFATFLLLQILEIPIMLKIAYLFFVPVLITVACFAILIFYPVRKVTSRAKNMEVNVPFVIIHMGAIAESGVPPYVMFKLISQFKEYGEVAKEMEKIVRNIEAFGMDPLSAIKEVAKRCPSESLKQVLHGIVTTTESGGDLKLYLKTSGEQALFEWRTRRQRFAEQLSAYAEFYTGILIAAPLFIIALFAVMAMIQPTIAGYSILELTKISVYALIPLLNIIFIIFLKGVEVPI